MRIPRKQFPVPLSPPKKRILKSLAVESGLTCCGVIRQLIFREHQATRHAKTLATREVTR